MSGYSVYLLKKGRKVVDTQVVRHRFSFWTFLLGPIYFLFYKMWKEFLLYFLVLFGFGLLHDYAIVTGSFLQYLSLSLHLFIAVDFSHIREKSLLSKGYVFDSTSFNDPVGLLKLIADKAI